MRVLVGILRSLARVLLAFLIKKFLWEQKQNNDEVALESREWRYCWMKNQKMLNRNEFERLSRKFLELSQGGERKGN
jgi:hypothetical protein